MKLKLIAQLFLEFAKIGCFTFGGGYAMLAPMENICVARKKWVTHEDFMNMVVLAESTPGPIAINCATYVGYLQAGFAGAVAATVGMIVPSFVIIYVISRFLDNFLEIAWVASAFHGIKIAVGILILDVGINMLRKMKKKFFPRIVMLCAFLLMLAVNIFSLHISTIVMLLAAAAAGLLVYVARGRMKEGGAGNSGQEGGAGK